MRFLTIVTAVLSLSIINSNIAWPQPASQNSIPHSKDKTTAPVSAKPIIAVFDLDLSEGVNPALRIPISDAVRQAVTDSEYFDVVERSNIKKIVTELDFQSASYTIPEKALSASKGLNATLVLLGNVGYIEPSYTLALRVIDVESGKNLANISSSERGAAENLIDLAGELCGALIKKWAPQEKITQAEVSDEKHSPLESEQVFVRGGVLKRNGIPLKVGSFKIDKTEVTNAQYAQFLKYLSDSGDRTFCHPAQPPEKNHIPDHWNDPLFNQPLQPVVGIDWYDAYAYASWTGKRLPTEEEWELAATGGDGRIYPWGNTWDARMCNNRELGYKRTRNGGSSTAGASAFGVLDMAGNAAEWCDGASGPVLRGGSFADDRNGIKCSSRMKMDALSRNAAFGLRCVSPPHSGETGDLSEYIEIVE